MHATLDSLPEEILSAILRTLLALLHPEKPPPWHQASRACGVPLSSTSRELRVKTLPWVFHETTIRHSHTWPANLLHYPIKVHLLNGTPAPPHPLLSLMSSGSFSALTTLTVCLQTVLPVEFFSDVASISLRHLEIYRLRLDAAPPPLDLCFQQLATLVLCIGGSHGTRRDKGIDRECEWQNITLLLNCACKCVEDLSISGDLLSLHFPEIKWKRLKHFSVTDHPPRSPLSLSALVGGMPLLTTFGLLYTPHLRARRLPPYSLKHEGNAFDLIPNLVACSLSNIAPEDPVFGYLPTTLECLHVRALWDIYDPKVRRSRLPYHVHKLLDDLGDCPLPSAGPGTSSVIACKSEWPMLTTLSLTVSERGPGSDLLPTLIQRTPHLRSLELNYRPGDIERRIFAFLFIDPWRVLITLKQFQFLTHLTFGITYDTLEHNPGPPAHAAYDVLVAIPTLQTVTYRFTGYLDGSIVQPLEYTWGRDMLFLPRPPRRVQRERSTERTVWSELEDSGSDY
ncbi:hypothetical protein MIND_00656500 [Mycena indigotica]|uniref:Uncharacterized protein n=1 Tax=Mycena indigotica TaxID=2126181 RepID=A0A8H6SK91_9AGAR|nr:uncharacterized protein MIND_00656500 [Mycena indigotica]KAF7300936.1 hypothetical protein MIND_00656500 [Mycena indigotica]